MVGGFEGLGCDAPFERQHSDPADFQLDMKPLAKTSVETVCYTDAGDMQNKGHFGRSSAVR